MSKIVFRYFFDFFEGQEKWLNSMAEKGYRLKKCGKMLYIFDECKTGEYEYAVEFVGDRSYAKSKEYRNYLDEIGFRTFTKNINLNFSYGKVKWRPYAKGMGQIATSTGSYNKELLIVEKKKDGNLLNLHTDVQDKLEAYKTVRYTYFWAILMVFALVAMTFIPGVSSLSEAKTWILRVVFVIIGALFLIPAVMYSLMVSRLRSESQTFE